jgi:endonuclease/exonuclease/phosphatase family metal-dependent hydrolase
MRLRYRLTLLAVLLSGCVAIRPAPDGARAEASCRAPAGGAAVQWLLPEEERAALDAWCAAVGPALALAAGARPVQEPGSAAIHDLQGGADPALHGTGHDGTGADDPVGAGAGGLDSLMLVSWNVHVGGGDIRGFVEALRRGAVTGGGPVEHFALLLQEVHRDGISIPAPRAGTFFGARIAVHPPAGRRASVEALARELALHLLYIPSMRNGTVTGSAAEDRGNAILSTLPLRDPLALELPVERQRRVAVAATIDGSDSRGRTWSLQLVSVHLENRVSASTDGLFGVPGVAARGRQMRWLLDRLPQAERSVLAGDLNTWLRAEGEQAAQTALARYPHTPALPRGPTHVSHSVFRSRLDYIFARVPGGSMAGYTRAGSAYGSDHFPLLAWIRLAETEDARGRPAPGEVLSQR